MKIAIIGTGRVGLSLLHFVVNTSNVETVFLIARSENSIKSAIMQVASVNAKASQKIKSASNENLAEVDIIVMTAGAQMKVDETPQAVKNGNAEIAKNIFANIKLKSNAIIIVVPTPVDDLTVYVQQLTNLPKHQVIGFGGDLDYQRLLAILLEKKFAIDNIHVIGEHGKKAIPVYSGEKDYFVVATRLRNFLSDITQYSNAPLNLATGILLNKLIDSLINKEKMVHYICGYHEEYKCFITWPFLIGRLGVISPIDIHDCLEACAKKDLQAQLQLSN